jgi:xanthine dehydrogenase YagR molybdenum-binding subunit
VTTETDTEKKFGSETVIGKPTNRIDGPLKVTGTAKYSSDYNLEGMVYAVPVCATIASGTIKSIDLSKAQKMPGVVAVYCRANIPKIFRIAPLKDVQLICDEKRPALADDTVRYYGQFVAVAVAETMEQANAAANAVVVEYDVKKPNVSEAFLADAQMKVEHERGDAATAFESARHKLDVTYSTPPEFHSAIELHASVATFDGKDFTLYETTQAIMNFRSVLAQFLGVEPENVRVITKFLGSGFGGKLWPWSQSALAATIARELRRPVKLVMSRRMAFQSAGHRPATEQRIRIGADDDGRLVSLQHDFANHRSILDQYQERCGEATKYFYSCPNVLIRAGTSLRNVGNPTSMRGPGAVPGLFATESALDELACLLKIDPVQLRILNEPTMDEGLKIPFATRKLLDCYKIGADKFGWHDRNPAVGSMKKDGVTLGWGTAGAGWIAERVPAEASVELRDNGAVRVLSGTQDIGTGTYTVIAQMVAEVFQLPLDMVEVVIGDSSLPPGPFSGGSLLTGSIIPAVVEAARKTQESLLAAAQQSADSPFSGIDAKKLEFKDGKIRQIDKPESAGIHFKDFMTRCNYKIISGKGTSTGTRGGTPKESRHAYGTHFVEVGWEKRIARLRVRRVVTVIDSGRILNPKAGRNQIEGAIVMGLGMALFEQGRYEPTKGAPLNSNFADYVMPVHADMPDIDVHFLETPNKDLNEFGAKGVGEIGLAGIAAAIASAVHHATGIRVRDLPIRIEDLLQAT